MSTYSLFGFNYLILPKFDVLFRFVSGRSILFPDKYMRWFALFCFICGIKYACTFIRKVLKKIRRLMSAEDKEDRSEYITEHTTLNCLPPIDEGENKYMVLFGFGDSKAGVDIVKIFSKMGYNCLLMNREKIIAQNKISHPDYFNLDDLKNLKTEVFQFSYEEFFRSNKLVGSNFFTIEYIIDATLYEDDTSGYIDNGKPNSHFEHLALQMTPFKNFLIECKDNMNDCSIFIINYKEMSKDMSYTLLSVSKYREANDFLDKNSAIIKKLKCGLINDRSSSVSEKSLSKLLNDESEETDIVLLD